MPFAAIRKAGALFPGAKEGRVADADYRGRRPELLVRRRSVAAGARVLLIDDWIETGNQARAAAEIVAACGGSVVGISVVVDQLADPSGLPRCTAIVRADDLPPSEP